MKHVQALNLDADKIPDKFKSEYLYNVRHAYGDVGGDSNRRGRGYTPYSCQKLLTEALPSSGQAHGCPYRTYSPDNLISLLQNVGVADKELTKGVRELVGKQKYHVACNLVFEHAHKNELKKVRLLDRSSQHSANKLVGEGRISLASKRTGHHPASEYVLQAQLSAQEPRESPVWGHWRGRPWTVFCRVRHGVLRVFHMRRDITVEDRSFSVGDMALMANQR